MNISMQHWNDNIMCAIHTTVTNPDPLLGEIVELCVLCVDSNIEIRKDVLPLYIYIKPNHPERMTKKCRKDLDDKIGTGFDAMTAIDLFEKWFDKLNVRYTNYGNQKKLFPLAHNWASQVPFIQRWLGYEMYDRFLDHRYRDVQTVPLYIDDNCAMHSERVPYPKVDIMYLSHTLMTRIHNHSAIEICQGIVEVYKKLTLEVKFV